MHIVTRHIRTHDIQNDQIVNILVFLLLLNKLKELNAFSHKQTGVEYYVLFGASSFEFLLKRLMRTSEHLDLILLVDVQLKK